MKANDIDEKWIHSNHKRLTVLSKSHITILAKWTRPQSVTLAKCKSCYQFYYKKNLQMRKWSINAIIYILFLSKG